MGKIRNHGSVHREIDLDRRTAQFGMRRGAGIGSGEASKPGYIAGQFDDALVVDVVQHRIEVPGSRCERPWRLRRVVLYMDGNGGNTVRPFPVSGLKWQPIWPSGAWG